MIAALLLLQSWAAPPAQRIEHWEPWLSWGCMVREAKGAPFVVNGVVARRNDPDEPIDYRRHERALRVLRDDSGAFSGLQARSPLFVARKDEFWAYFPGPTGGAAGSRRFLVLKVRQPGTPGVLELYSGEPGSKPYAAGTCLTRLDERKAKP